MDLLGEPPTVSWLRHLTDKSKPAKLLSFSAVLDIMQSPSIDQPLSDLIPLLFPFFRHTIPTVRLAVVNTILVFLNLPTIDHSWADSRLLRLLFQNFIVEDRLDVRLATSHAWHECLRLGRVDPVKLTKNVLHLAIWFKILTNPIGVALDPSWFWSAKMSYGGQAGYVHNVDKAMLAQDLSLVSVEAVVRGRLAGAVAMGELIASWSIGVRLIFSPLFKSLIRSSTDSRFCIRTILSRRIIVLVCAGKDHDRHCDRGVVNCSSFQSRRPIARREINSRISTFETTPHPHRRRTANDLYRNEFHPLSHPSRLSCSLRRLRIVRKSPGWKCSSLVGWIVQHHSSSASDQRIRSIDSAHGSRDKEGRSACVGGEEEEIGRCDFVL